MKIFYRAYQLIIATLVILVATILTSFVTTIGCLIGNGHFWGYYPGKIWSHIVCGILLLPVKVEGSENLKKGQSYIFVANHQGALDIFMIYGFLGRNFKWMMKKELRKMPLIGIACDKAHHIFVDKSGPKKIEETIEKARATLKDGISLVVFPEGTRTFTGKPGRFKKGAFMLADELQLPVVPITISGSFEALPRTRGMVNFVERHTLRLTLHTPIPPQGKGLNDIQETMQKSYQVISDSLSAKTH